MGAYPRHFCLISVEIEVEVDVESMNRSVISGKCEYLPGKWAQGA